MGAWSWNSLYTLKQYEIQILLRHLERNLTFSFFETKCEKWKVKLVNIAAAWIEYARSLQGGELPTHFLLLVRMYSIYLAYLILCSFLHPWWNFWKLLFEKRLGIVKKIGDFLPALHANWHCNCDLLLSTVTVLFQLFQESWKWNLYVINELTEQQ